MLILLFYCLNYNSQRKVALKHYFSNLETLEVFHRHYYPIEIIKIILRLSTKLIQAEYLKAIAFYFFLSHSIVL